jgi:hypothetical protein
MKLLVSIIFTLTVASSFGKEWVFHLKPSQVKVCSTDTLRRPKWFVNECGIKNMVNLSFFTHKTFIPPFKDERIVVMDNPKKWPFLSIEEGVPYLYNGSDWTDYELEQFVGKTADIVISGYPILIKDGEPTKPQKTYFWKRRCARTAIGFNGNGEIILYVTSAATLKDVQKFFISKGCTDAINFDGGSSTFLYLNGKNVYTSNEGRSYPNVLYWN